MPDPKAKDVSNTPESSQPSPNDVSGYYERDPDDSRKLTDEWVDAVDTRTLDPESHVEVIPRDDRSDESIASRPLNPDFRS